MRTFSITGELTSLNDYIDAERRHRQVAAKIKHQETHQVAWQIKKQKVRPITEFPVHITYVWYSKDAKKDIDNVSFSKKFINDGMVLAGIIPNDGRKQIASFSEEFLVDKENPRVEVNISTIDDRNGG